MGKANGKSVRRPKAAPALSGEDLGRMRVVLESQRALGSGSYPPTVSRLFELIGMTASEPALKAIASPKNAKLFTLTAKSSKKEPEATQRALVFLPEDKERVAASPALLERALDVASRGGGDLFKPADLARHVPTVLRRHFQAQVTAWTRAGEPPIPGLLVLRHKAGKTTTIFLHRAEAAQEARTAPRRAPDAFARDFAREFERLDRASGNNNYVLLHDLRRALPDLDRAEFDRRLNELRMARLFTLDSPDGRHVRLSPEQLDAGIREGSSNLVYVARR